jgi:hypothetical protein
LSKVAFGLLIGWIALSVAFIVFVALARRSKRRQRERGLRSLRP